MPISTKLTLDVKDFEAALNKANKSTAKAGSDMERQFHKGAKGVDKLTAALGGASSKLGEFGEIIGSLAAGPIAAVAGAFAFLVAAGMDAWDQLTLSAEEYAHKLDLVAADSDRATAKMNSQQGEDSGYMDRLQQLASKEKLSNEAKTEAANIIRILTARYGDLGVSIDSVTGAITGADEAQQKLAQRMTEQRKQTLNRQYNAQYDKAVNLAQSTIAETAKDEVRGMFGGTADNQKFVKNLFSTQPISQQLMFARNMRNKSHTKDRMDSWQKVIDTLEKQQDIGDELRFMQQTGSAKGSSQKQKITDRAQKKTDLMASEQSSADYQDRVVAGEKFQADVLKLILEQKKQGVTLTREEAELVVRRRQASASNAFYSERLKSLDSELKIQNLILQHKGTEAEREKLIFELKKQGLSVDEKRINAELAARNKLASLDLLKDQKTQATSLYDQALRASGHVRQADTEAALRKARELKTSKGGGDLTSAEIAMTKRLAGLNYDLNNPGRAALDLKTGMEIQTNALTSRGGFAGGAVAPDKDSVNREILSYNKRQSDILTEINKAMTDINSQIQGT